MSDDEMLIPDERLRPIFVCCHPALSRDARVALTRNRKILGRHPKRRLPPCSGN